MYNTVYVLANIQDLKGVRYIKLDVSDIVSERKCLNVNSGNSMSQICEFVRNRGTNKATSTSDQNLSTVHVDWEDVSKANSRQSLRLRGKKNSVGYDK